MFRLRLAIALALVVCGYVVADTLDKPTPAVQVFFSPKGGCTDAVVAEIGKAKASIRVQMFAFTSQPIASALIAAQARKVDVQVILDGTYTDNRPSVAGKLAAAGIPVLLDSLHPIAHNKVCVIDGKTVVTGSFNYTKQAESNAENLVVIRRSDVAADYTRNWQRHANHSEKYAEAKP